MLLCFLLVPIDDLTLVLEHLVSAAQLLCATSLVNVHCEFQHN